MTSDAIIRLLIAHRHDKDWCCFPELRIGTGFGRRSEQRLDLWCIHTLPSTGWTRATYEVKVSRNDFRRELKKPLKRRYGLLFSNRFFFAAPKGVVPVQDLPPECGLIEVVEEAPGRHCLVETVAAPWRDTSMPSWNFLAAICRRREMDPGAVTRLTVGIQERARRSILEAREARRLQVEGMACLREALVDVVAPEGGPVDEALLARLQAAAPPRGTDRCGSSRNTHPLHDVLDAIRWRQRSSGLQHRSLGVVPGSRRVVGRNA